MTENESQKTLVETLKNQLVNSNGLLIHQLIQIFIKWYNRQILIFSIIILFCLPISMITIGSLFYNSCQKIFYLPLHMIICGSISFLSTILLLIMSFLWKRSMKLTSDLTCHKSQFALIILSLCEIIFLVISLLGLVLLTIILIRNSSNHIDFHLQTSSNYCHPIVYYSSYVILFLFYTIFSLIMIILLIIFHAYHKTQ